ncbi:MAG: MFS transporter [Peptococcaceae bacterium]|jgi:MFS family permease|nr:MFS transporter [Peptococcaceae bacterium]
MNAIQRFTFFQEYGLLAAVILELVFVDLGSGLTTPVLPLFAGSLGAGIALTGIIVGAIGVSRTLTDVPAGYLATMVNRRLLLSLSPLLVGLAAVLAAIAPGYWLLIPARLLEGAGMALVNTVAMITLADSVAGKGDRGRIMSLYQAVRRGGNGLGPLLGGLVADALGYRAVYVVYAALALASFAWAWLGIPRSYTGRHQDRAPGEEKADDRRRRFLRHPGFIVVCLVAFVFFFGRIASRRLIIPVLGRQALGLSASSIGLALTLATVSNLLTLYFIGNLTDRIGSRPVVVISGLLSAAALAGYALSDSFTTFVLASLFWGFCSGFGGPARNVFLMDIAPEKLYPFLLSVYRTVADVGFIMGPLVLGLVSQSAGFRWALYAAAGLFVAVTAAFYAVAGFGAAPGIKRQT